VADRFIRASEVGEYVFCARAWWLGRVVGRVRENPGELALGRARHAGHARSIAVSALMQRLGLVLILAAIVVAVLLALSGGAR
jgi:hypothetical protein